MADIKEIPSGRFDVDSLGQTLKGIDKAELPQIRDAESMGLTREQRQEILEEQMRDYAGTNPVNNRSN